MIQVVGAKRRKYIIKYVGFKMKIGFRCHSSGKVVFVESDRIELTLKGAGESKGYKVGKISWVTNQEKNHGNCTGDNDLIDYVVVNGRQIDNSDINLYKIQEELTK